MLTAATLSLVPAAWLVPSWVGSGDPLFAGGQARSEPSWSLSLAPVPWRAALDLAQSQTWLVLELGALGALAFALVALRWPRLPRPAHPGAAVALAGFGGATLLLYAVMTEAGFSGNVRYVLAALVAIAMLGGVGVALLLDAAARRVEPPAAQQASPSTGRARQPRCWRARDRSRAAARPPAHRRRRDARGDRALACCTPTSNAPSTASAPRYVTYFGPATVNRSYQTHLAWELKLPLGDVHGARGRGHRVQGAGRAGRRRRARVPAGAAA